MSPKNKLLWLFSGTSDGNQIAKDLIAKNCCLKVFVATPYGRNVASQTLPLELIQTGRLSIENILEIGRIDVPEKVIDATHPFAVEVSKNLMEFCRTREIPYIRYERPEECIEGDNVYFVENVEQAAEKAKKIGGQILLTLGSKNIDPFLCEEFRERISIRMLPDPQLIQDLLSKRISPDRIIAIQGPFSISLNKALMVDRSIDCLVTKSSGKEGGVEDKIVAARELDISVIVIKRPDMEYPTLFSDQDKMIDHILKDQ
jgi:cobalt-factor III methyltransferase